MHGITHTITVSCLCLLLLGCSSLPRSEKTAPTESQATSLLKTAKARSSHIAETSRPSQRAPWQWETTYPKNSVRAALLPLDIPADAVAHVLPSNTASHGIQLVSTAYADRLVEISHVARAPVATFADVLRFTESTDDPTTSYQVDFAYAAPGQARGSVASKLQPSDLRTLLQSAHPHHSAIRFTEEGREWVLLRSDGVRCKLSANVDRRRGLVHLIVGIANCWGAAKTLPVDIQVAGPTGSLRCLKLAETLERLYGEAKAENAQLPSHASSFASVSEHDEYLMAYNYQSLVERIEHRASERTASPPTRCALIRTDEPYPGPAILGDARALGSFLMQRQILQPGQPEHLGWVMFGGDLQEAKNIVVRVDLGNGPRDIELQLPR